MPKWFYWVCKLLSYSPVLRTIDKGYFGEIKKDSTIIQLNVMSLSLGEKIVCILYCSFNIQEFRTWIQNRATSNTFIRFGWGEIIALSKLQPRLDDAALTQKRQDFEAVLSQKSPKERDTLAQAIQYKINDCLSGRAKVFNKFLAYLAVIAFMIPIYIPYLLKIEYLRNEPKIIIIFYSISIFALIFCLTNIFLFSYRFIRVGIYNRFLFYGLKSAPSAQTTSLKYTSGLYYDWQDIKNGSEVEVTTIKNIEKYLQFLVIWSVVLIAGTLVINISKLPNSPQLAIVSSTNESHIIDGSVTTEALINENVKFISQTQEDLLKDRLREVIIISNEQMQSENYIRLIALLEPYNIHNIPITKISNTNASEVNNDIQIILIRR